MTSFFKLALSLLVVAPSLAAWLYLFQNRLPLQHAYLIAYGILLWAVLDFIIIVCIEPYRRNLGKLTIPSFIAAISIVLLYIITESLNRFIEHLGYAALTPFAIAAAVLVSAAVFKEKNIPLKCYLSLNSLMLSVLWAMGDADKVTMPF